MQWSYFVIEPFTVTVNYRQSLKEMIIAGNYDKVDEGINEKLFPFKRRDAVNTCLNLIKFGKDMTNSEIFRLYEKYNIRSANAPELLAFSIKYPNKQKKHRIIALGNTYSMFLGYRISIVEKYTILRTLTMYEFTKRWPKDTKFLTASK